MSECKKVRRSAGDEGEEAGEQGSAVHPVGAAAEGQALGMELNPPDGAPGVLQRLGKAALRPGDSPQARPQTAHRLVVPAVYREHRALEGKEDAVLRGPAGVDPVLLPVGDVERAHLRSWMMSPPRATLMTCIPRQMPKMGLPA